jgi:hypothetical protein
MKLPNAENAIVDIGKLRDYCLSPTHLRGRHKARVFQSALNLTLDDAVEFQAALKQAAVGGEAVLGATDSYGIRYIIDFELSRRDHTAIVRSCWIVPFDSEFPRFLTCYVL